MRTIKFKNIKLILWGQFRQCEVKVRFEKLNKKLIKKDKFWKKMGQADQKICDPPGLSKIKNLFYYLFYRLFKVESYFWEEHIS